jgi:tetratricopeptide (TPR) repeat protein
MAQGHWGSAGTEPHGELIMSMQDRRGLEVSGHQRESLERYQQALELTVSYFVDPLAAVNSLLEDDPSFASGHALRAALGVMSSERGAAAPLIEASVAAIEAPGSRANDRERAHAVAARTWLEGDFAGALRRYGDIVCEYPRDLLALQTAHVCDFFLGQSTMLRDRVAQVLPAWDSSVPGYGYVVGMHAFGLEETGLYDRAEDAARKALEMNARDPWAVHALVHVLEMQGRHRDGIETLTSRAPDWSIDNAFAFHNWWHLGLFHLDLGEHERVFELYDQRIRPVQTQVALEMVDASAMLWRLHARGIDVGSRWQPLADAWRPIAEEGFYAFNDCHAVMAFAGAGDFAAAERSVAALERAARGEGTNALMSREVGLPFANGMIAFARGQYDRAIDELSKIRAHANLCGGSHAQRDIIPLTLIEAALRGGRLPLARAIAAERTELKRTSPFNWRLTERVLLAMGRDAEARRAAENAELRLSAQQGARVAPRAVA